MAKKKAGKKDSVKAVENPELITLDEIEELDDSKNLEDYDISPEDIKIAQDIEASLKMDSDEYLKEFLPSLADEVVPEWAKFKEGSIQASIDAGEILPELKPRINAVYRAVLLSLPELVKSKKGDFYTVKIDHDGMIKSLKANRSFNFCLTRYVTEKNIPFSSLIGKILAFQKDESGFMKVQIK
ncbi:hypothetical protein ES702_06950 [subsurface metagenome]